MKECVICKTDFVPYTSLAKFCSHECKLVNQYNKRKEKADALPKKKCLFCNKVVNRPRRYKYCSDKCHKAMTCKKVCDKAKLEVRERHSKMLTKHCKTCNIELETTVRNYHQIEYCKPCRKDRDKQRRITFYEENKEEMKLYWKERHERIKVTPAYIDYARHRNELKKIKTANNPIMVNCNNCGKEFRRMKYNRNCSPKCSQEWIIKKRQIPINRISGRLRLGLRRVVKGTRKVDTVWRFFDFTKDEFMSDFESKFTDGMSWDNMSEWHIDHIRPVSSFNFTSTDCEDFKKCWALNNLQPLWAKDNHSKNDKWDGIINK
jgi:hypothetical protein